MSGASKGSTQIEQFAPELILRDLSDPSFPAQPPRLTQMPAVAMFADISGYTKLCEEFAQLGALGAENLAFWLNRCDSARPPPLLSVCLCEAAVFTFLRACVCLCACV